MHQHSVTDDVETLLGHHQQQLANWFHKNLTVSLVTVDQGLCHHAQNPESQTWVGLTDKEELTLPSCLLTSICILQHTCTYSHTPMYTHTLYTLTHTCTCIDTQTHTHTPYTTHTHTYTHIDIHSYPYIQSYTHYMCTHA